MARTQTRMTEGSIPGLMLRFAAPLFFGNLFQQLYNTADALIVGRYLGDSALAAVSSTGSLIFLLISLFEGIAAGAGVIISRYYGARDNEKLHSAVHTSVAFALATGIILTVLGTLLTPWILRLMGTPEDVMPLAVTYTRIFFAGSLTLVMYNSLRGVMQAVGDGKDPLIFLAISSITNVILDIVFIRFFHTGVGGAALATVISQLISAELCFRKLLLTQEEYRVSIRDIRFEKGMLRLIISYGLPSGLQNSVIGFANVVVQSNINAFGTMAMSGLGAYSKIEGFAFLPITSFNIALTTFVGQNLGAGEYTRTKRGARFGIICAVCMAELIGVLFYLAAPVLIGLFTEEPEAIAFGVEKVHICALFFCLLAASHSYSAVLRGAGKAVVPMIAMLAFWCVIRVAFLQFAVPIFKTIAVVNWVYPLTWFLSTVFLTIYYFKADWIHTFEKEAAKS